MPLIKEWKPNKRQAEFISLPDSIFEALYGGAAGGGKSEVLLGLPLVRKWYENPRFKGIIFRRTFPELEESLILRSKTGLGTDPDTRVHGPSYKDFGATYNGSNHVWTFPSGATIRFSFLETDDDARSHDTAEYNYIGFDELTAFEEFQYIYLTSRCRTSDPSLPALVRSASNPGNIGHAWVRDRFVAPYKVGGKILLDPRTKTKRIFIPAKLADNPALTINNPNYANVLQLLPEAERRAKVDGDWFIFEGQVFTEFRASHRPDEPSNAQHVIAPFKIPEWWPKFLAIDWGFSHKTGALWGALSPDNRIYIYREYFRSKEYISTWASNLRRYGQFDGNLKGTVLDPSAWQNRGDPKTISIQFTEFSGLDPEKANNDRIGGKLLIHEFLRWKERPEKTKPLEGFSPEKAQEILRRYGLDAMKDYEDMFLPTPPELNIPQLQIFTSCPELIKTIPLMIYDDKDVEDIKKFDGDDLYDTLRYLLQAFFGYLNEVQLEHRNRLEVDHILASQVANPNHTKFYRQMEYHEATVKEAISKPVQRPAARRSLGHFN